MKSVSKKLLAIRNDIKIGDLVTYYAGKKTNTSKVIEKTDYSVMVESGLMWVGYDAIMGVSKNKMR